MSDAFWTAFWVNVPMVIAAIGGLLTVIVTLYNGIQSKKRARAIKKTVDDMHTSIKSGILPLTSDLGKLENK